MLESHRIFTLKWFFLIPFMLFSFIGCGGGGQQQYKAPDETSSQETKALHIQVSPQILKTAYLPKVSSDEEVVYSIENALSEGNVTLLDETTGRYSYLSAKNVNKGEDSFSFKVMKGNTVLLERDVNIQIHPLEVKINEVVQNSFSSGLPIVIIDTGDKTIPDEPKIKGSMVIIEPDHTGRAHLGVKPDYGGYIEIEIRGFSSQRFSKKQYSVDTETWDGEDDDVSLLGMPKEHKWILHAPYSDKSLMRNYLAYHKTREIDESQYYAVRSKFVEVLTRTKDHYRYDGVYVLLEKIKRDKNRLDIKKLKEEYVSEPEMSGGYILQQDRVKDDEEFITGISGQQYIVEYPKAGKLNAEQFNYIEEYVGRFEGALDSVDYNNTGTDEYYANWIDEDSFIVHILAREFFRDYDNWRTSEYFYKRRSGFIYMGPVWDFNMGMGNSSIGYEGRTDAWSYIGKNSGLGYWVERLMRDPIFRQKVSDKWHELRSTIWSNNSLIRFIEDTQALLTEPAKRNFERWPVLGKNVFRERQACTKNGVAVYCDTFESAVNEHLKVWLLERAQWIDEQFK